MTNTKKIYTILIAAILAVSIIGVSVALVFAAGVYSANSSLNFHIDPAPSKPNFILSFDPNFSLGDGTSSIYYYECDPTTAEINGTSYEIVQITSSANEIQAYTNNSPNPSSESIEISGTYLFNTDPQSTMTKTKYMNDLQANYYMTGSESMDLIETTMTTYDSIAADTYNLSTAFTLVNPTDSYLMVQFNLSYLGDTTSDAFYNYASRILSVESLGYALNSQNFGDADVCNAYYSIFSFASEEVTEFGVETCEDWAHCEPYLQDDYKESHASYKLLTPSNLTPDNDDNYIDGNIANGAYACEDTGDGYVTAYVFIKPKSSIKCGWDVIARTEGDQDINSPDMEKCEVIVNYLSGEPTSPEDLFEKINNADSSTEVKFSLYAGFTNTYEI